MRWLAIASVLLIPPVAWAQRLVEVAGEAAPFHVSGRPLGPVEERGELVFFARDIATHVEQGIRVGAGGVAAEAGLGADVVQVASCGGVRWVLGFESLGMGGSRWTVSRSGGPVIWRRSFPMTALPDVRLACAGLRATVGWLEDGEIVIGDATATAVTLATIGRARVMQRGTIAQVPWAATGRGEVFVLVPARGAAGSDLLRIDLAQSPASITHRQSVPGADGVVVVASTDVLVATAVGRPPELVLSAFATADLAPRTRATVAVDARHSVGCTGLWLGPAGRVAVGIQESWIGDDFVAIPQGPNEPDRFEPSHESAGSVRLWMPAHGAVGPPSLLGARWVGAAGWRGDTLVMVQPVEPAGVVGGVVQLRSAQVRRFTPAP